MLDAAYTILVETGLANFSIETVALRSGVSRPTIYRWWATKGLLAIESFLEAVRPQLAYGRTGEVPIAFRSLVGSLARVLAGPAGRVAASVVAHAQSDPETQRMFIERFSEPLRAESTKLLHRGIEQGHLRADLDIPRVLDAAVGAVYLRLLLGQSLSPAWAKALSDTLLHGCLPSSGPPRRAR